MDDSFDMPLRFQACTSKASGLRLDTSAERARLTADWQTQQIRIAGAFAVMRHITSVSSDLVVQELTVSIGAPIEIKAVPESEMDVDMIVAPTSSELKTIVPKRNQKRIQTDNTKIDAKITPSDPQPIGAKETAFPPPAAASASTWLSQDSMSEVSKMVSKV